MNPCFVNSNESTQKFIWITLKHLQILFWNRHTIALMIHSEQTRHPSCRCFFISNSSCKIEIVSCDMPQQVCALSLIDQSKQYHDFIDDFWRSSLNWNPEWGALHIRPRLNSFIQLSQTLVQICCEHYPTVLISFGIKPFIYRCLITAYLETRFFHFAKKAKIVRFNRLQKWNHVMNSAQNLISWEMLLVKK